MDRDMELYAMEEEQSAEDKPVVEEKPTGRRQFNDTLLVQLMCATPVTPPRERMRRIYGVMSDTPVSRRTRLYKEH